MVFKNRKMIKKMSKKEKIVCKKSLGQKAGTPLQNRGILIAAPACFSFAWDGRNVAVSSELNQELASDLFALPRCLPFLLSWHVVNGRMHAWPHLQPRREACMMHASILVMTMALIIDQHIDGRTDSDRPPAVGYQSSLWYYVQTKNT